MESQKIGAKPDGTYKSKGITARGAANLRIETTDILIHANPHDGVSYEETTHLVVGYVQSGKTMSFTALSALAKDNGYRVIIYLAGVTKNLLQQTSRRLKKDLVANKRTDRNFYIHEDPTGNDLPDILGHLALRSRPTILIPTLKHYKHINELAKLFESRLMKEALENETVIIIDDEADQASLNGYARTNSKQKDIYGDTWEEKESKTFEAIRQLRTAMPGNTYIQYTATPQANLLISIQDILSPKSHTLLTPGEGYIGGKQFFGMDGASHDLFKGGLIRQIPEKEVFHKKKNQWKALPQSLKDALLLHVLAVAIVVCYRRTEGIGFLSMMVHVDETKNWNKKVKEWIDKLIARWRKDIGREPGHDDREHLLEQLHRLYPMAVEFYDLNERPTLEELLPFVPDILNDCKTWLVNSDDEAQTEIAWDEYSMHVLVGAQMLNRGFTVENLATTYMPRHTTTIANADTIEQRCRFFGYKNDYIRSCRVFLPERSIMDYRDYIKHEEELRTVLGECDTLEAANRKILLSPTLKPTRLNVLPMSVVREKLSGLHEMQAFENRYVIENNDKVVKAFLQEHEKDFCEDFKYNTLDRTHRSLYLTMDEAIKFLNDFRFVDYAEASRKTNTIRYLRYLKESSLATAENVRFIQMAWQVEAREREFDMISHRVTTRLCAGQSSPQDSTNYPGDRAIVDANVITIQLHHIKFKSRAIDFPQTAYALAINYPDKLATSYYSTVANDDD